MGYRLLLAQIS